MSTTYIAALVNVLVFVLPAIGVHVVDTNALTQGIVTVAGVVATAWIFYGRFRAGGITAIGLRKD